MVLKRIRRRIFNSLPWNLSGFAYRVLTTPPFSKTRFRMTRVGEGSYVDPSTQIIGWKNVFVGANSTISEDTFINVNFRDDSTMRIVIGNNCHIGRRNFFSSGPAIRIKDYCFTGLDCQFLGCGHNIDSPLIPYIASGPGGDGIIEIGVNCWLATSVTVAQSVKIGCGTVVGAHSFVMNDLPPFSIAVGIPCKVIKRFDFRSNKWVRIEDWTADLERYMPTEEAYLQRLTKSHARLQPSLISGSRRFGWL